jgi:nitrogen-specific signal transduction histidine kinase
MVEREAPGVAIYKNYEPGIPPFPFDAELMERVFYNLALNAVQATAPGGAVTVKSRAAGTVAEGNYAASGLRWDGRDHGQLAARLSEALAGLSREIAAALPHKAAE